MKFENEVKLARVRKIMGNLDKALELENKEYLHRAFSDARLMQIAIDRMRDVVCRPDEAIMLAKIQLD